VYLVHPKQLGRKHGSERQGGAEYGREVAEERKRGDEDESESRKGNSGY